MKLIKSERAFDWSVALYMFLIGLAGSLFAASGIGYFLSPSFITTVLLREGGYISFLASVVGIGLIYLHLSQRKRFLMVFSHPTSVVTVASSLIGAFAVFTLISSLFWLFPSFLLPISSLRPLIIIFGLLLGLIISVLPGVELGSLKARPLWYGPLLPVFFACSSYTTGLAIAQMLIVASSSQFLSFLRSLLMSILALQLVFILLHTMLQPKISRASEKPIELLLRKDLKAVYLGGGILLGCVIPIVLLMFAYIGALTVIGSILILVGGFFLRYSMIEAGLAFPPAGEPTTPYELRKYLGYVRKG